MALPRNLVINGTRFPRQIFEKSSDMNFYENPSSWSRVFQCGRMDRHEEANSWLFAILRTRLISSMCKDLFRTVQ